MPKLINKTFLQMIETNYTMNPSIITWAAHANTSIKFKPVAMENSDVEYIVQRQKRTKAQTIAESGKIGDDLVTIANAGSEIDWDSIMTKTSEPLFFVVKKKIGMEIDMSNDSTSYAIAMNQKTAVLGLTHTEHLIELALLDGAGGNYDGTALNRKTIGDIPSIDLSNPDKKAAGEDFIAAGQEAINKIAYLTDDFKYMSENIYGIVHPYVLECMQAVDINYVKNIPNFIVAKKETPLKGNGMIGTTILESNAYLNAIPELATDEKVLAIFFDGEAFGSVNPNSPEKLLEVSVPGAVVGEGTYGVKFYELSVKADNDRVIVITGKLPATFPSSSLVNAT